MTDTTSSSNTTSTSDSTSSNSDSLSSVATAQLGGGKKKNGHKMSCGCPICINMKHAKHGGSSCSTHSGHGVSQKDCSSKTGGKKSKKKGNGHKPSCGCPICKNMKKKRGGDPVNPAAPFVDLEKGPDDFKDLEMGVGNEVSASDNEYMALDMATNADLDEAEKGDAGVNIKVGGTRRRKRRGSRSTKRAKKTNRKSRKGKRTHRRH